MTNKEYRKYVHDMYMNNFVRQGKKPKALQIFGDSFGHFSGDDTWIGVLAKKFDIPVFNYAWAGSNLSFTLSQFYKNYDKECLNIFLVTGEGRISAKSDLLKSGEYLTKQFIPDIFACGAAGDATDHIVQFVNHANLLPDNIKKEYKDAIGGYFKMLYDPVIEAMIWRPVLENLFVHYDNTVFLNCFNTLKIQEYIGNVRKEFRIPNLLECDLFQLSTAKSYFEVPTSNTLIALSEISCSFDRVHQAKWNNMKNHFSAKMNSLIGEQLYAIFISNEKIFITYDDCCDLSENDLLTDGIPWRNEANLRLKIAKDYNNPNMKNVLPVGL